MSEYITTALRDNRTTRSDLSDSSKHIHWLSPRSPQQPSITGLQVPACTSSWPLPEDLVPGTAETSVTYHFTWLCAMTYNMQPCQLCKQRQLHYSSKNRVSMCGASVLGLGVCQEGGSGGSEITRQNVPLWNGKLLRLGGGPPTSFLFLLCSIPSLHISELIFEDLLYV